MAAFDASTLPPYTVIRIPQAFQEQDTPGPKRLVVIGHVENNAICIKATSKTEPYKNNQGMRESCVFIEAGKCSKCFPEETVVQPDNQVPLSHATLNEWQREGTLDVLGQLPTEEFEHELLRATDGERVSQRKKARIVLMITNNREKRAR